MSQGIILEPNVVENWYNEKEKGYKTYSINSVDQFDF